MYTVRMGVAIFFFSRLIDRGSSHWVGGGRLPESEFGFSIALTGPMFAPCRDALCGGRVGATRRVELMMELELSPSRLSLAAAQSISVSL